MVRVFDIRSRLENEMSQDTRKKKEKKKKKERRKNETINIFKLYISITLATKNDSLIM